MSVMQMSDQDYADMIKYKWCHCGSKLPRRALKDGYGIFLTYTCDKCERTKLKEFRSDIMSHYSCDEAIESD